MTDDTKQRPIGEGMFHGMPVRPYFVDETRTETRHFPRPVTLTLPDHTQRKFQPGLQEVPVQLLDDPWLLKNGMVEYDRGQRLPPLMRTAPVGSQGYGAAIHASGVYDATLVPDARITDDVLKSAEQFAIMAQKGVDVAQANLEHAIDVAQAAQENYDRARAARVERDQIDPAVDEDQSDRLTPAQRKSLAKERAQNEAKLGLDQLSEEDRAKFDALSAKNKATYLASSPEDRAGMLAAADGSNGK